MRDQVSHPYRLQITSWYFSLFQWLTNWYWLNFLLSRLFSFYVVHVVSISMLSVTPIIFYCIICIL
jgi:hypothetical protein